MAKQTSRRNRQQRPVNASPASVATPGSNAEAAPAPAAAVQSVNWKAEYGYVIKDIRRTLLIAGAMFALLIILNFALN